MTTEELNKLAATHRQVANTLRANSNLKSSAYPSPVLGLIYLKFADNNTSFAKRRRRRGIIIVAPCIVRKKNQKTHE